jgi:hypothetical protein
MSESKWMISLNDDTPLSVSWCGAADNVLWISGIGLSLQLAMSIFSDPSKTSRITAYGTTVHEGYTRLIHIVVDNDGTIKVALRKEV